METQMGSQLSDANSTQNKTHINIVTILAEIKNVPDEIKSRLNK